MLPISNGEHKEFVMNFLEAIDLKLCTALVKLESIEDTMKNNTKNTEINRLRISDLIFEQTIWWIKCKSPHTFDFEVVSGVVSSVDGDDSQIETNEGIIFYSSCIPYHFLSQDEAQRWLNLIMDIHCCNPNNRDQTYV